jgi:hypothetical protein
VEKWGRGGNVYENKGSYPLKAGMYMKTSRLMFSAEISHDVHSYTPTGRGLRGGEISDIAICEGKRKKGGLDLALADAERKNFFLQERRGNVYENKGALWKSGVEPGMSMKIKVLIRSRLGCM